MSGDGSHPDRFDLAGRGGLPDGLAHLLAKYPREDWREHADFAQLADFWLQAHDGLRHEGRRVQRLVHDHRGREFEEPVFRDGFAPLLSAFLGHLDGHHRVEDVVYFPKFRSLDPRLAAGFDLLESDHSVIHHGLVATVGRARDLLEALQLTRDHARPVADAYADEVERLLSLLLRHFADEEELVIPAMLEHGERPFY